MDPKRIIEDGYDRLAPRFEEWNSGSEEVRPWFMDEILQRLPAGADVLELGCGAGTAATALAVGRSYTGVDLSGGQLAIARERLPEATFLHGDLTGAGFKVEISETRSQLEEGEGEAPFHRVIARKPVPR